MGWQRIRTRAPFGLMLCGVAAMIQACSSSEAVATTRQQVRIATAFGPLSEPLAAEYRQRLADVEVRSETAADSIAAIERNTVDVGVAFADDAYFAYEQKWPDASRTSTSALRGIALLLPLPQCLLVRPAAHVASVADLRGKRVGVGPAGSPVARIALQLLDAFNVRAEIVHCATRAEGVTALKEGTIDAGFLPGYLHPDPITEEAIRGGAHLVPIAGPPVDRLRREHPFVRVVTIPRGIYPGQDRLIPTVGVEMVVLCRRDLDPALAYQLTARLFDAFPRLIGIEATLRYLNLDEAAATPVPLHPGAVRYFRERELSK